MPKTFSFEDYVDVFSYKDPQSITTRVFSFEERPEPHLTTYTCQDFTLKPETFDKDLLLISKNKNEIDIPSIVNAVAKFFLRHPDHFHHGRYTPSLGFIDKKSKLSAFYVSHPMAFDSDEINFRYLSVIAISENELKFLETYGSIKFEEHLIKNNVDTTDLLREDSLKRTFLQRIINNK